MKSGHAWYKNLLLELDKLSADYARKMQKFRNLYLPKGTIRCMFHNINKFSCM